MASRMWGIGIAIHTHEMAEPILVGTNSVGECRIHIVYNMCNHYTGCCKHSVPYVLHAAHYYQTSFV